MKIAVVTDDGETISAHFGRAKLYAVITIENGILVAKEQREKPAHQHHSHETTVHLHEGGDPESANTHGAMVAPVQDCQVLLSRGMGRPAYDSIRAAGLQPIITDVKDIEEAVQQYVKGELADHPERLH